MSWMLFWKIVFIAVLSLFAVMTVFTTFLGARDIRKLFRKLDEEGENQKKRGPDPGGRRDTID
ncbi:MAG: putative membrane protein [Verrucomicrobiales bacterium]|jgi:uncharacterized membrane protein